MLRSLFLFQVCKADFLSALEPLCTELAEEVYMVKFPLRNAVDVQRAEIDLNDYLTYAILSTVWGNSRPRCFSVFFVKLRINSDHARRVDGKSTIRESNVEGETYIRIRIWF